MVRSGLTEPRKRMTISQYFASLECVACGKMTQERLCPECVSQPSRLAAVLATKARAWERAHFAVLDVCTFSLNVRTRPSHLYFGQNHA